MSYNLRPERKRKRPARYNSVSVDELEDSPNPTAQNTGTHVEISGLSTNQPSGAVAYQTPSQSLLNPLPTLSLLPAAHGAPPTGTTFVPRDHRDMTNIRYVRKNSQRLRVDEHQENDYSDASSVRRPLGRSQSRPAQQVPHSIYPSVKPAAFPSLSADGPPLDKNTEDKGTPGVRELMEAMEKSDQEGIHECKRRVDNIYDHGEFPEGFSEKERTWYTELKGRWGPNESVVQIPFASLWPSLRQNIIEQIRDDFPPGIYYDPYHPVKCLLGLPQSALDKILSENSEVWNIEDDIPRYLREFKRLHPNDIIDPDEPPAREVVKAIKFLKQEHLPASLLGEWQYELPSIEDFFLWSQALEEKVKISESDSKPPAVYDRKRDRPDVLTTEETLALLRRIGWKPAG